MSHTQQRKEYETYIKSSKPHPCEKSKDIPKTTSEQEDKAPYFGIPTTHESALYSARFC